MKLYEFLHHAKELRKANNATAIFYVWYIDETKKATKSHISSTPMVSEIADNLLPCDIRWEVKNAAKANGFFGLEGDDAFNEEDGDFIMVYIDGIAPKILSAAEIAEAREKAKAEKDAAKKAEREAKKKEREAEKAKKKAEKETAKKAKEAEAKAKAEADAEVAKLKAKAEAPKESKETSKEGKKKAPKTGGGKKTILSPSTPTAIENINESAKARKKAQKRAKKA